jgi:hypothetical protein
MTDGDSYRGSRNEGANKSYGSLLRLRDETNQGSEDFMAEGSQGLWIPARSPESAYPLVPERPQRRGFDDWRELGLLDENGKLRLLPAQRWFENEGSYGLLPEVFESWRDFDEYLVLRYHSETEKPLIVGVKAAKRGNDVYVRRLSQRLRFIRQNYRNERFFSLTDFTTEKKIETGLLWVTLTWDPRLFSHRQAWRVEIGKRWNRYISGLRRKYGKILVLRSWESTKQGYPHVHALLMFETARFHVFPWLEKPQKGAPEARFTFRIQEKDEVASGWPFLVDVQAVSSTRQAINYVLKYQMKVHGAAAEGSPDPGPAASSRTLSFMWLFRKRSFACSRELEREFSRIDLIGSLHNSNMEKEGSWEFLGVLSGQALGLHGEAFVELKEEQIKGLLRDPGEALVNAGISSFPEVQERDPCE